ncbi:hypothetical protein EVAR_85907_1 [Eumeta japonica]|uniref:Uncharacterized protein n=1 Tax=Eumeta variegata TaxID=151549 RepID=A0A4C2A2H6_EUMVA|nr:hypothetical protein EVAR_85907_1 [Eumeta japonica]
MDRGYTVYPGKVLHKLSESEQATPRVISIDSMSVGYEKAMSIISKHSSLRETQDRNLGTSCQGPRRNERLERLRKQIQAEKETKPRSEELAREQRSETGKKLENFFRAFNAGIATKLKAFTSKKRVFDNRGQGKASTSKKITNDSPKSSPKPTKADLEKSNLPSLCLSRTERPHEERLPRLKRKLEENEGTIYNNVVPIYTGDARQNMAAYNDTCGLVYLDEQATKITGKAKYETPENDPIVVMTRDTKRHILHTGRDPIIDDGWLRQKQTPYHYQTLYLAHTQAGKTELKAMGWTRANNATSERIIEYNAKMAIRSRDINSVREITKYRRKRNSTDRVNKTPIKAKKGVNLETKRTKNGVPHTMTSQCAVSERTGCLAPLKWLSWTMADRPVVLVNGCRATGTRTAITKENSVRTINN